MMMWFLFLLYLARTEPVISQGSTGDVNRLVLKGDKPCEGHIEIYHNGVLGYVGHTFWSDDIEKVVCRSAHCGKPDTREIVLQPGNQSVWLNDIKCNGSENHLWECKFPGWGVISLRSDEVKKIKCSDKIEISLDGHRCAGAVQYSINDVNQKGYFCAENWGRDEANVLCKSLGCGQAEDARKDEWKLWKDFKDSEKKMLDCSGIEDYTNLWQCVTNESPSKCKTPVSVKCTGHERIQLKKKANTLNVCSGYLQKEQNNRWIDVNTCEETACPMLCGEVSNCTLDSNNNVLLTCKDNVSVVLKDKGKPSRCYGTVHIEVNGEAHPVCASTWTKEDAEVVCKELDCGSVVTFASLGQRGNGIMDNVNCSGTESSLWYCNAKHDNKPTLSCTTMAYVACSDSMNMRFMDGSGRCAGRVEIYYEGRWQSATEQGWDEANSNTVCKQHGCGTRGSTSEKYIQGSGEFLAKTLKCDASAKNISECTITESATSRTFGGPGGDKPKAVSVTCEEHKVVFLEGTCSGKVGIQHGDNSYWLSGYNDTWNNKTADTVCQQMQCGKASDWDFVPSANLNNIWKEVYNCSSNSESLFGCEATKLPSDYNETTIASVTCSERRTMKLTKGCWGTVNVCMGGNCGGVCQDSWTEEKSKMLCKELGCGNIVLHAHNKPGKTEVLFMSLHTTKQTTHLTECNFVRNNEKNVSCEPAYVVCSGSVKPKFDGFNSRYKCSGNVVASYEGQLLPVCSSALSDQTQNTICKEMKCGRALKKLDYFGPKSGNALSISQIVCPENAKSLKACNVNRSKDGEDCALGGLQCSSWRKVELKLGEKACTGHVFVHSEEGLMAVSTDHLTNTTSETLCRDLNCGKFIKSSNKTSSQTPFWNRTFSCRDGDKPENIWKCETAREPSQQQHLFVECQDPNVTLSSGCYGEVRINKTAVCSSNWNSNYSDQLCAEKACGSIALPSETGKPKDAMYHLNCDVSKSYKLGECSRYKEKCDHGPVSVYCVDTVKFITTEKCGGEIEVRYQGKMEKVCKFPDHLRDNLCKDLGCGNDNETVTSQVTKKREKKSPLTLQKTVVCNKDYKDYKYCVKSETCKEVPAEIYCDGYVLPPPPPPPSTSPPIVPIIVGVGLILVLVILIAVFVRLYIARRARRAKRAMNASSRMISRKEVEEFESGDYEDVTNRANEMEDFSRGKFRPDAEVFMESDARSNSSLPYDDIDEAVETRPLTSPAASKAGAPIDSFFQDGTLDQSTDGVTYEVDDPQENYDDIEPVPEVTQTKAEVHASHETTSESVTAAPPGRVQGDGDYLVPDQDG